MKPYALLALAIATFVILSFVLVEALEIPLLTDPSHLIGSGGWVAAVVGAGLLLADVFLPVPSSLVMIAHGAAFGVVGGFLLSLGASVGGAMIGWWVGRSGSPWMDRLVTPAQRAHATAMVNRHGLPAIVFSRMVPVLAETFAIMAGATRLDWKPFLLASILGSIPPALVYAIAGAITADFGTGALVTVGVVVLAGVAWWIGRRRSQSAATASRASSSAASARKR